MKRHDIINKIGDRYHVGNLETGEFSYVKALKSVGKDIRDYQKATSGGQHQYLDIRFENDRLVILVECKNKFSRWDKNKIQGQLQDYVRFEKAYSDKKIVAILAETEGDDIWVWYGQSVIIDDEHKITTETTFRTFEEYEYMYFGRVNDKIKIVDSIKQLNEKLHSDGITEKLRSQFVGTCLLALKNGLVYKNVNATLDPATGQAISPAKVILKSIKNILEALLTQGGTADINKASKLTILNNKVLGDQDIANLTYEELKDILGYIDDNIVPYINDKSTAGQDLLNLFFTTFNKYVGKSDKNQAFTPDHICDFMSKAVGVNKNSRVLDPCCGSGAFLVRAMTDAMDDCETEEERDAVKKEQIFGIEYEDGAFGLSSTNMLIHGDGNSNVIQASMFDKGQWITDSGINVVLMNPPYNATKKCCYTQYTRRWGANQKEDPSKGLHFVEFIARHVSKPCKMAVLLPMQAAIGNSSEIKEYKKKMLDNYTLDAVFSLPNEMFYPGASAVACCMVFDLSQKHERANRETFFGYFKDDKFVKRKGLGRVEKTDANGNSLWTKTEEIWLELYRNRKVVPGLSVMHKVSWQDEWLAEAYMETDYSTLSVDDFQKTINDYLSFMVKEGTFWDDMYQHIKLLYSKPITCIIESSNTPYIDTVKWEKFLIKNLFDVCLSKGDIKADDMAMGTVPLVSSGETNNGIVAHIDRSGDGKAEIFDGNMLTVDMFCNAFYQREKFYAVSHGRINILIPKFNMNQNIGLFISAIINREKYKYSYGRAVYSNVVANMEIKLPIQRLDNQLIIDETYEFSSKGYIPDWEWMEKYIKSLLYSGRMKN